MFFLLLSPSKATYSIFNVYLVLSTLVLCEILVPFAILDVVFSTFIALKNIFISAIQGNKFKKYRCVVIGDAGFGLGKQLALDYSSPGRHLILLDSNQSRLNRVVDLCRDKGSTIDALALNDGDMSGRYFDTFYQFLNQADDHHPVDLIIANAGIANATVGMPQFRFENGRHYGLEEVLEQSASLKLTDNVILFLPLLHRLMKRKSGHIVLLSCICGIKGFPNAPFYNSVSEAIYSLARDLRYLLGRYHIQVSALLPGFTWTYLPSQWSEKDEEMSSPEEIDKAISEISQKIRKCIDNGAGSIALPFRAAAFALAMRSLPLQFSHYLLKLLDGFTVGGIKF